MTSTEHHLAERFRRPALTAILNDYSFEMVFARQLEALGRAGDVAIGISTSGNAGNVLAGLRAARAPDMVTVALTALDEMGAERSSGVTTPESTSGTTRCGQHHR